MKKNRIIILFLSCMIFLSSCITLSYNSKSHLFKDNYEPLKLDYFIPEECFLKEDENPIIMLTDDNDTKIREVYSDWYSCIGVSKLLYKSMAGIVIRNSLYELAKEKKAKLVVLKQEFVSSYDVPNFDIFAKGNNNKQEYYNYYAYFFVTMPEEHKHFYTPGFTVVDLTELDKRNNRQNFGCLIDIVYKDTVAYYANLFYRDIITSINGQKIYSADDFEQFRKKSKIGDKWTLTILRDRREEKIDLIFDLYEKKE